MYKKIIGLAMLALLFSGTAALAQTYDYGTPSNNTNQTTQPTNQNEVMNQNTTDTSLNANDSANANPDLPNTGAGGNAIILMTFSLAAAAVAGSLYLNRKISV